MPAPGTGARFEPLVFGPYHLLDRLAVGGMAEIFLAREIDSPTQELIVVKRLLPHIAQHPELVQMFIDEVRVAATLDHRNVVNVYNVGSIGDTYFQSMEYLRGVDLRQVCQAYWSKKLRIPRPVVLQVLIAVADGLAYVHDKNDSSGKPLSLIHRDLSPHNIFVTSEGVAKILDFGVAKAANALHQTRTGVLVGKLGYMSPEQARTEKLDQRSDLFSLGIVMWELFAGRRLMRVKQLGEFEVLRRLCEEDIPPPSTITRTPAILDTIVLKATARNRDERYAHARDIAEDLRKAAAALNVDASEEAVKKVLTTVFAEHLEAQRSLVESLAAIRIEDRSSVSSSFSGSAPAPGSTGFGQVPMPMPGGPALQPISGQLAGEISGHMTGGQVHTTDSQPSLAARDFERTNRRDPDSGSSSSARVRRAKARVVVPERQFVRRPAQTSGLTGKQMALLSVAGVAVLALLVTVVVLLLD